MRNIIFIITICILTLACQRESDEIKVCYSFINDTSRNMKMETYRYNSAGAFLQQEYEIDGAGTLAVLCDTDFRMPSIINLYEADSLVVKFDNNKMKSYTGSQGQNQVIDDIFFVDQWENELGSNNFFWRFTEDDYNNAVPY